MKPMEVRLLATIDFDLTLAFTHFYFLRTLPLKGNKFSQYLYANSASEIITNEEKYFFNNILELYQIYS